MSVYRKREGEPYSYDFQFKGHRFSGTTGCHDKREADKFEKAEKDRLRAEFKDEAKAVKPAKEISIAEAAAKFYEERAAFHANSLDAERYLIWIANNIEGGPDLPITKIDNAIVTKLVAKRRGMLTTRGTRPANSTVNRHTEYFRMMMLEAKKVWKVPVEDIEWKKFMLAEEVIKTEASPDQEAFLMTILRGDYAPSVRFTLLTGVRLEEVVGLEWTDVRFHTRDFTVWGKGKDGLKKERTIPMTKAVYDLLWSLKDDHPTAVFTYVAVRTRDGRTKDARYPITYNGLKTEWRRTKERCEKAGRSFKGYRFHDNRHTAATRLVRATGNLKQAQLLLGHTDIKTTSRYAHVTHEDLRAGLEAASPTKNPTKKKANRK
ncbi:site-specific integrase [Phyllobacterium chamaecytisi]|uniref:site-specific integrase n=1 Tax=Phyllobacterium chamaecytisi TaxID=2876082 RepID=UPI001CCE9F1A|nr:site-specific integrase [Phyllobacterium sp. KW56]MBZ9600681.1 site-specific integrase [Phyllobacterium sp. KW56]